HVDAAGGARAVRARRLPRVCGRRARRRLRGRRRPPRVIELRRPTGGFARVGHRGASALAPENTPEAFPPAVDLGCDMLELDVLAQADGTIVVAHDPRHLRDPGLVTFDEALAYFAEHLPNVGLQVDLKRRGIESRVVEALKRHGAF